MEQVSPSPDIYSGIKLEIVSTLGDAEQRYKDPMLDELFENAVNGQVPAASQSTDPRTADINRIIGMIMEKQPPREWVLLKSLQGFMLRAAVYEQVKEPGLQLSQLKEALKRARHIKDSFYDTVSPLPSLETELEGALNNSVFAKMNWGKTSLLPPSLISRLRARIKNMPIYKSLSGGLRSKQ